MADLKKTDADILKEVWSLQWILYHTSTFICVFVCIKIDEVYQEKDKLVMELQNEKANKKALEVNLGNSDEVSIQRKRFTILYKIKNIVDSLYHCK